MKKIPILLAILLLSACNPVAQPTSTVPVEFTIVPTLVVDESPDEGEELPPYAPQTGDSALTKARAMTNKVYVLYSGTEPTEVLLHISGYLPTPCHQLRVAIPAPDENGDIFVEVYALTTPDHLCEQQVLRAYDVTVNMGTYPSGSYWVWVNGGIVGNFDY